MALRYALYTSVGFQIVNNRNKGLGSDWTPADTIFTNLLSSLSIIVCLIGKLNVPFNLKEQF